MTRRTLALALLAAALFALDERASYATAAPPADAGADAAPPAPPFDAEPLPTDKSPAPKPDEWRAAQPVSITRDFSKCRAYRVREWMKIDCTDMSPAGVSQVGGTSEGVQLFVAPAPSDSWFTPRVMEVVFPLRRGAGHVFQFLEMGAGYDGPESAVVSLTLADSWVDGEAPIITMH